MKAKRLKILGTFIIMLFIGFLTSEVSQAKEKLQEADASIKTQFSIEAQQYLWEGYSKIKDNGDGTVTVSGYTKAYQNVNLISLTLYIQVEDGTGWRTVKSWSYNAADTDYVSGEDQYPVQSGKKYRAHGVHEVWHNGTYESATTTTGWIIP